MRPLILDCDTGADDAVALMLAATHPSLDLLGVTTVWGNHRVAETTANTRRVLAGIGRPDVPVHPGLDGPFIAQRRADEVLAVDWLLRALRSAPSPVTLVQTGPLSNLARAIAEQPALVDRVEELVIMGGSHAVGNVTPSAERNVWNDAPAASAVLAAGFRRLVLIPLDATHQVPLTAQHADELALLGTAAGRLAAGFVRERLASYAQHPDFGGRSAPVHDALTVAYLLDPAVVSLRHVHVAVETAGELTYGRTVLDLLGTTGELPNAHVALGADPVRFFRLLRATFAEST